MSDINTIRVLIADQGVYVKEEALLLASAPSFQVVYAALVARGVDGVIITLENGSPLSFVTNPFTLDLENGVVTFTGTVPAPQILTVEYSHVSLTDASIQTLLDLNVDGPDPLRLAAADALDAMADSQAMILKKIKLLDLETDGPALAKALRDHAATLRKLVYAPEFDEPTFDIIEQVNSGDSPAWWEKVRKDWQRGL